MTYDNGNRPLSRRCTVVQPNRQAPWGGGGSTSLQAGEFNLLSAEVQRALRAELLENGVMRHVAEWHDA